MKKYIFFLILGIYLIFLASATYETETSINPGEMNLQSDNYEVQVIIQSPSGHLSTDNYEVCVGFLCQDYGEEKAGGGKAVKETFGEQYGRLIGICLIILVLLIILFIIIREEKEKRKQ